MIDITFQKMIPYLTKPGRREVKSNNLLQGAKSPATSWFVLFKALADIPYSAIFVKCAGFEDDQLVLKFT